MAAFVLDQALLPQKAAQDGIKNGYLTGNFSLPFNDLEVLESKFDDSEEQALYASYQDYMKRNLFTLRDKRMASRIHDLLLHHPTTSFFFSFGAGHFVGPASVRHHLEELGYTITHVKRNET